MRADISALTRPRGHRFVAGSQFEWESLKVGGGPPPIRVDEGWLLIHHGVSGTIHDQPVRVASLHMPPPRCQTGPGSPYDRMSDNVVDFGLASVKQTFRPSGDAV